MRAMRDSTEAAPYRLLLMLLLASCALAGSAAAQEPPTFRETIEVEVREVDVVVLDRDGNPLLGLTRADFELFENGRPVEIVNFAAYQETRPGPATATIEATEPAAAPRAPADLPEPAAAPPTTWVVYLDQSRLSRKGRLEVLDQLERFFRTGFRAGDRALVASFDGEALSELAPLGTAPERIAESLRAARKQTPPALFRVIEVERLRRDMAQSSFDAADAERLRLAVDAFAEQDALRTQGAFRALHDLLAMVGGFEGRLALLLAGGGFSDTPGEELYRAFEARFGSGAIFDSRTAALGGTQPTQPDRSIITEAGMRALDERTSRVRLGYARLLDTLNSGRVTVYTIYAGDERGPGIDADDGGGFPGMAPGLLTTPAQSSSLARFSTATGGRAFVAAPDLAVRLGDARRDLTHYYSLGYRPAGRAPRRQIEVRVRHEGARVSHRKNVAFRATDILAGDAAITELLGAAASPDPFGVAVEVGAPVGRKKNLRVPVEIRVPLRQLTLLPEGDLHRGRLLFQFALRRPDGAFLRLEPRPIAFEVPAGKLDGALAQHVSMRVEVLVEPGPQRLAVSVLDENAGVVGTVATDFAVDL